MQCGPLLVLHGVCPLSVRRATLAGFDYRFDMVKSTFYEKGTKMGLKIREKKDGRTVTKFVPCSNFVFNPVAQLGGDKDGFLVAVKTFPHGNKLEAYVPSNPKRDEFVYHLNRALYKKGGGGLSCSLPETVFKAQFVKKILNFQQGDGFIFLRATNSLGKVRNDNVWVLTDKVQMNSDGKLIKNSDYVYVPDDIELTLEIACHHDIVPLFDTLQAMRLTMMHNFPAVLFALGAVCMINHVDHIEELFEGCPTVILVGQPGRGKTTAMKLCLSALGMLECGMIKTFSKEKILKRASATTMGIFIDDPPNSSALKELIVDFFNRAKTGTIARGIESVRCGLMVTANDVIVGTKRELRRVVYIPFLGDSLSCTSSETVKAHVQVKKNISSPDLSGAISAIIATGGRFRRSGWSELADYVLPYVKTVLDGRVLSDCALPYAILLWFTKEMFHAVFGSEQDVEFLETFFEENISAFAATHQPVCAPEVQSLYSPAVQDQYATEKVNVLASLDVSITTLLKESSPDQIRTFVKLGVHKGIECITIHPSFFEGKGFSQQQVTSHLTKAGYGCSQPRRFPGRLKSERCLLVHLVAFSEETRSCIQDAFDTVRAGSQNDNGQVSNEEEAHKEENTKKKDKRSRKRRRRLEELGFRKKQEMKR